MAQMITPNYVLSREGEKGEHTQSVKPASLAMEAASAAELTCLGFHLSVIWTSLTQTEILIVFDTPLWLNLKKARVVTTFVVVVVASLLLIISSQAHLQQEN